MPRRVLVIGIDGGDPNLIETWTRRGLLPNIKKIMEDGVYGKSKTTPLPITASAWTSFMTGKNPASHGIFDFVRMGRDYKITIVDSNDIDSKTIWDILNDYDKKIGVINVPNTYPVNEINGFMIAGMPAPLNNKAVYPEEMLTELKKENYKILPEEVYIPGNEETLFRGLEDVVEKRRKITLKLMKEKEWDIFMVVFSVTDTAGHWFWKHMDKKHPSHKKTDEKYKDVVLHFYKKVDSIIGEMMKEAGDTNIIIMSDHGTGPLYKDIFLNNWFIENGYMKLKNNFKTKIKHFLFKKGLTLENLYEISQKLGIAKRVTSASERSRSFLLNFLLSFSDVDWSKTKAYSATNYGPIFINLKGRESEGIVSKEEYEHLRKEIMEKLKQIRNESGEYVIERVFKKEEVFSGKYIEVVPDIIYWTKNLEYTFARYFEFGSNKLFGNPHRDMSGDHRMYGIFVAYGPDIGKGKIDNVNIIDLAPTILQMMNIPIPEDMEGKVLKIFKKYKPVEVEDIKEKIRMLKEKGKI